jgi:hypothetical protein
MENLLSRQQFRRQQHDIACHLPGFQPGVGLGRRQKREVGGNDRFDLVRGEQMVNAG